MLVFHFFFVTTPLCLSIAGCAVKSLRRWSASYRTELGLLSGHCCHCLQN